MNYWLDLFTVTTWDEFRKYGAKVTGFRYRLRRSVDRVKKGDIFICYLTKVMRWVGALEVVGPSKDKSRIWKHDEYPVRFDVKPILMLDAEYGIPMDQLEGKVDFYVNAQHAGKFKGFLRMSPNLFKKPEDGKLILDLIREAERNPIKRKVDKQKLYPKRLYGAKRKKGKRKVPAVVSIPESEEESTVTIDQEVSLAKVTNHTEVQYHLLKLGADMSFDIWVARNDRSKNYNGQIFGKMPQLVDELPPLFNEAVNKTIELIDVLWLKGNSIIAAFEIEYTTSVYSGLLRMSDLLALQPNINIKLYLVAPDDRRTKVEQEILRPTFTLREKPINEVCGFLSFSILLQKIQGIQKLGLQNSIKPDFLDQIAEYFGTEEDLV